MIFAAGPSFTYLYLLQVFSMYNTQVIMGYEEYLFSVTEKEACAGMP